MKYREYVSREKWCLPVSKQAPKTPSGYRPAWCVFWYGIPQLYKYYSFSTMEGAVSFLDKQVFGNGFATVVHALFPERGNPCLPVINEVSIAPLIR